MGTDDALVAVLADHPGKRPDHARTLQTTPATARDTPETANLKTDAAYSLTMLPNPTVRVAGGRDEAGRVILAR